MGSPDTGEFVAMSESIVLEKIQSGDKQVFKILFETYYTRLLYFGKKYLDDDFAVEDMVQDCFVALWERRAEITDTTTLKSFLFVSLRNRCLNYLRDRKNQEAHHQYIEQESVSFFEHSLIEEETRHALLSVLDRMSEQGKSVCLLIMEGLKNAEIAEQLGITTSTVKYHKVKAREILQSLYKS